MPILNCRRIKNIRVFSFLWTLLGTFSILKWMLLGLSKGSCAYGGFLEFDLLHPEWTWDKIDLFPLSQDCAQGSWELDSVLSTKHGWEDDSVIRSLEVWFSGSGKGSLLDDFSELLCPAAPSILSLSSTPCPDKE